MEKYFTSFVLLLITISVSCKKNNTADEQNGRKATVTTIAGDGNAGYMEGAALSARFNGPSDVAVTTDGIMYVTDNSNHRIRKIAGGEVTTFAGSNTPGIVNNNGVLAQFSSPYVITADINKNLYSLDGDDSRVRKISPTADVVTYAGRTGNGFADGDRAIAQFYSFGHGITADDQGVIYIADTYNHRIRKISVSGEVSTIAGSGIAGFTDGAARTAQFSSPGGIIIDRQGNLYVSDKGNYRIRKITPGGEVSTFAGTGTPGISDGKTGMGQFDNIGDIVIDSQGNLYVVDNNRIRRISTQGTVATVAGGLASGYADGDGPSAKFNYPIGLGTDTQDNVYVADYANNRIRKISFQ